MTSPHNELMHPTFSRMDEYRAILENLAGVSSRRQNANNVYVGLNTVFLTALGVFMAAHLGSWAGAIGVVVICAVVTPVNIIWRTALIRYSQTLMLRYDYLREIESGWRGTSDAHKHIGLFLRLKEQGLSQTVNTRIELHLTAYVIWLYSSVAIAVLILTYLVQLHIIPSISL